MATYKVTIDIFDTARKDAALRAIQDSIPESSTNKDYVEYKTNDMYYDIHFHSKETYEEFVNNLTTRIYEFTLKQDDDIIKPYEISINLDHNDLAKDQYMLMKRQIDRANDEINILDFALSEFAEESNQLEERLDRLEEYLAYSGLIYYQSFFSSLLKELDEQGVIDIDNIDVDLVQAVH